MYSRHPERFSIFPQTVRWLFLATCTGVLSGSASALFLLALDVATRTRESHHGLILGLPVAGFVVGWIRCGHDRDGACNSDAKDCGLGCPFTC